MSGPRRPILVLGITSVIALTLIVANFASAANSRPGPKEIWDAIDNLQAQIDEISQGGDGTSESLILFHRAGVTEGEIKLVSTYSEASGVDFRNANIIPTSGTINNLIASLNFPPGLGESTTLTLIKNEIETTLSCTMVDSETTCSNTTDTVQVETGDHIMMKVVGTSPPSGFQSTALSSVVFNSN